MYIGSCHILVSSQSQPSQASYQSPVCLFCPTLPPNAGPIYVTHWITLTPYICFNRQPVFLSVEEIYSELDISLPYLQVTSLLADVFVINQKIS